MDEHSNPSRLDERTSIGLDEVFAREPRDSSILVADGYGLRIQVERGHLVIHDGIGEHRRTRRLPRVERTIKRMLILGHTGGITLDALAWCHDVGIAVTQLDPATGNILMAIGTTGRDDPRLRRAQALAATRPIGLEITKTLIGQKITGQAAVLLRLDELKAAEALEGHAQRLADARAMQSVPEIEAKAAIVYFNAWTRRVAPTFATRDQAQIPAHWLGYDGRRSLLDYGRSPRKAATPVNAILNYCYALAEAECRITLVALGLDPGLGILHADKNARDSLALDIVEPIRPLVDATVLDLLQRRHLRAADFHETPAGSCRILAPLSHDLAEISRGWIHDIGRVAEGLAKSFAQDSPAPIRNSTPITGANRKLRPGATRRPRQDAPASQLPPRNCRDCGATLTTGRELCPTCWPARRAAQAGDRALAGAAALARQRAAGSDPSTTPEAQAKRSRSLSRHKREEQGWSPSEEEAQWTVATYVADIWPALQETTLGQIQEATGLSISACSRIRSGELRPHKRHWESLRKIGRPPCDG